MKEGCCQANLTKATIPDEISKKIVATDRRTDMSARRRKENGGESCQGKACCKAQVQLRKVKVQCQGKKESESELN